MGDFEQREVQLDRRLAGHRRKIIPDEFREFVACARKHIRLLRRSTFPALYSSAAASIHRAHSVLESLLDAQRPTEPNTATPGFFEFRGLCLAHFDRLGTYREHPVLPF